MADPQPKGTNELHRPRRAKGGVIPESSAESTSRRRRRRRRIAVITIAVALALVLAAVALVGTYLSRLQSAFDDNRNVIEELDLEDETAYRTREGTINMLLLGTDSRGDEEGDYRASTGEGTERSDTIMFVHIPADRSGVFVMSIMRDLWVDVPGHGQGRVNTALGAGGYELVVEMVEELLYTHIDHVALIDFEGFSDLTTALGGVYVDNPRPFAAGQRNPAFYPEGDIRLEGADALRFVRERQSFPRGDYVRVENQQLVVRAVVERFLSSDTLTNPQRVMDVVQGIVPYMEVDSALDAETVAGYALEMRNLRSSDIHMFTMPVGEETVTTGGAQVILPDEEMMLLLQRSLQNGNMEGFLDYIQDEEDEDSETSNRTDDSDNSAPETDSPESEIDESVEGSAGNTRGQAR